MKSSRWTRLVLGGVLILASLPIGQLAGASHAPTTFAAGDVFVGVGRSQVQWWRKPAASWTLLHSLTTAVSSPNTTGMAVRPALPAGPEAGKLYVTGYTSNAISRFTTGGVANGSFGTSFNSHPESMAFDIDGDAYVGQERGSRDILKFNAAGNLVASYDAAPVGKKGTDRLDLASDQCTVRYVGEGTVVKSFDVCTNTQLADFASGLQGAAQDLRILLDGGVLVAVGSVIQRVGSGSPATYDAYNQNCWVALALGTDANTFLGADGCSKKVYSFDLTTGTSTFLFNAGSRTNIQSLEVWGGLRAATAGADLSVTKSDSPDPVAASTVGADRFLGYVLEITNAGPLAADDVVVTDELPGGTTFQPSTSSPGSSPECTEASGAVTCEIGSLAAGATALVGIVVRTPEVTVDTTITNTASVQSDTPDPNPANNTDAETTTVRPRGADFDATLCDAGTGCTLATSADGLFWNVLEAPAVDGGGAILASVSTTSNGTATLSVASISEATESTFSCEGFTTGTGQEATVVVPDGYEDPANPVHITVIFPSNSQDVICMVKDDPEAKPFVVPPCTLLGQAVPSPCIHKVQDLPNRHRQFHILILSGDPKHR